MKRNTLRHFLTCSIASALLFLGYTPASAQYYMNVFKKNGETVQFEVAELDNVSFTSSEVAYEYVDLGLSVNWATFNVGATKPEEYGDYFAWGETEPKDDYYWPTYKFRTSGDSYNNVKFSKYNTDRSFGQVDNKTVLDPEDDVAHVKWGGSWRMPTKAEWDELHTNCTWTWYRGGNTEFNGVAGYKVTSNIEGYTDRSIFLPAAGDGTDLETVGYYGRYWSSSLHTGTPNYAYKLGFYSGSHDTSYGYRCFGSSVRPVCP